MTGNTSYKFSVGDAITIYGLMGTPFNGKVEKQEKCNGMNAYHVSYRDNHGRKKSFNILERLLLEWNPSYNAAK